MVELREFRSQCEKQYIEAVLEKTSTDWAPWYIVPSDRKWYRNVVISRVLVDTLTALDMRHPRPQEGLDDVVID